MPVRVKLFLDVTGPSEHDAPIAEASTRRPEAVRGVRIRALHNNPMHGYACVGGKVEIGIYVAAPKSRPSPPRPGDRAHLAWVKASR